VVISLKNVSIVKCADDDVLAVGYWKLDKDSNTWNCSKSLSVHEFDFCKQTGSFYNSPFVKKFQSQLEVEDVIIVEVNPTRPTFEKFWKGTYKTIFGADEANWGKSLYVIYFQVGNTDDTRRVLYSLDMNDAREGRVFTTHYKELILEEIH